MSTTTRTKKWAWFFLIAEVFAVVACVYGLALRITWRYDGADHPHVMAAYSVLSPMLRPMLVCFLTTDVFLLLASPFFLRSLRSVAMRAWAIGIASLLFAGLLCFVVR